MPDVSHLIYSMDNTFSFPALYPLPPGPYSANLKAREVLTRRPGLKSQRSAHLLADPHEDTGGSPSINHFFIKTTGFFTKYKYSRRGETRR